MTTLPPLSDAADNPEGRALYHELQAKLYAREEEKIAAALELKSIQDELNRGKGIKTRRIRRSNIRRSNIRRSNIRRSNIRRSNRRRRK